MVVKRGEIWWAALATPRGSEPGFRRPVLVIQSDSFNQSRINTVIGAIITSNVDRAEAPGNVAISRRESGLPKKSVVNVSHLVTVDRSLFRRRVKTLPARVMERVDRGLRLTLEL